MNLKYLKLILIVLVLITVESKAQTIKLEKFEPKNFRVYFYFDSVIICTDTISLFEIIDSYGDSLHTMRAKNLINKFINKSQNDSIGFSESLIPYDDGIEDGLHDSWYTKWVGKELINVNKAIVMDKYENRVWIIKTKRIGSRRENYKATVYYDEKTKRELYRDNIWHVIYD